MSRLTVTEKEHWKTRIERRIDKAIDRLADQDPGLLSSVRAAAEAAAHESLGITEFMARHVELKDQVESLKVEEDQLETKIQSKVLHKETKNLWSDKDEVERTVGKRQLLHEEELLADSPRGQEILSLRREREELLDTVWLATSSIQIRELWEHIADLLGEQPTDLQQKTLADKANTVDSEQEAD